jgi:PAS domain S-box-containing protein
MNSKPGSDFDSVRNSEIAFLRFEDVYQTLSELMTDAFLIVRVEGGIVLEVNRAFIKMLGYHESDIVGLCVTSFMVDVPDDFSVTVGGRYV